MTHQVADIVTRLISLLGEQQVLTGHSLLGRSSHVWQMDQSLKALALVMPRSTQEVSEVLKICNEYRQPVVIHGGLTNLVGNTESDPHEIVISLEKLNAIEEVDPSSRTMTLQAGVILEHAQKAAADHGLLLPLNFGAKGSAQMGGIIATNAGGLQVLRYGMTRQLVMGLEVVMADGTVISSLKKLLKDNTGYDLKQIFVGSEGTLGIITKAVIRLVEQPNSQISALVGTDSYQKVVAFLKFMDRGLAGTLSSFELMWPQAYQALTSPPATVSPPLPYGYDYYVLLDSLGSDAESDRSRMELLLEKALEQNIILDAVPAYTKSEVLKFWTIREDVQPMVDRCNHTQQFDISLPISLIGNEVESIVKKLYTIPEVEKVFTFGHVADGNIHLVVGKSEQSQALINQINDQVYRPLKPISGSISAEHGVGVHKKSFLHFSRTPEEIALMKTLKKSLDPHNILNPGKILDV